jgi:hypothetical protein
MMNQHRTVRYEEEDEYCNNPTLQRGTTFFPFHILLLPYILSSPIFSMLTTHHHIPMQKGRKRRGC